MSNEGPSEELVGLVSDSNEKLFRAGSTGAEQAFGLGCLVVSLPLLGLVLLLYLLRAINLIGLFVSVIIVALAGAGLAALIAQKARTRAISETYKRTVLPEIERTLRQYDFPQSQFNLIAEEVLPVNAPLRYFLRTPSGDISDPL